MFFNYEFNNESSRAALCQIATKHIKYSTKCNIWDKYNRFVISEISKTLVYSTSSQDSVCFRNILFKLDIRQLVDGILQ